ncbi:MAG: phasin family protein [Acidiferrobacterales bacterium]
MQAEFGNVVDVVSKVNATAVAAAKSVGEINKRAVDRIVQQQLALMGQALESGVRQLNLLQESNGYQQYFAGQAELAKEATGKVLATTRETLGALAAARDELNTLVEQGVKDATAQVKAANAQAKEAVAPVKPAPAKKTA